MADSRDTKDVTQWASPAQRPLPGQGAVPYLVLSPPLPGSQEVPGRLVLGAVHTEAWEQAGWESVTPWAGVSAGLGCRVGWDTCPGASPAVHNGLTTLLTPCPCLASQSYFKSEP